MRRQYRRAPKLSSRRRQRLAGVLAIPLFFRAGLPALLAAYAIVGVIFLTTRLLFPTVDTNSWPFIVPTVIVMFATGICAFGFTHVLFVRWLLRYRTGRHGRSVALGDVLRASDAAPSCRRRLLLRAYGISIAELQSQVARPQSGSVA
jgi:hypothetical protein